jgi:hypothetical protein
MATHPTLISPGPQEPRGQSRMPFDADFGPFVHISDEDLKYASRAEVQFYLEYLAAEALVTGDWKLWVAAINPQTHPYAPHHEDFWLHVWSIESGRRPRPYVAIWPRGGGKSSSIEMATVLCAARGTRRYCLYVCETQEQSDDHVLNIGSLIEGETVGAAWPELGARAIGKYGHAKGWRRNRLITQSGFVVDALGLDTAARGLKVENQRPDLIVFDDLDNELDTVATTEKKIRTLTHAILPAGSDDLAVVGVQNQVLPDGIFALLADGRAEFLADRVISGPVPAVLDLQVESVEGRMKICSGAPTWVGQDLERCQEMVNDMGLSAFMHECQHDTEPPSGGMFDHVEWRRCELAEVPDLVRSCVWVDPAMTDHDLSDAHGIQADGIAEDGTIYRLFSWERQASPVEAIQVAIRKAVEIGADHVGIETDQGGDTWRSVFRDALEREGLNYFDRGVPKFRAAKGGPLGPKAHRASQMLTDYENGRLVHVIGTNLTLERALRRFPKSKPFDLVDASYWSWRDLRPERRKRLVVK